MDREESACPRIRTALFDLDGTLVDSNDAHARAWVRALADASFDVPFERVRPLIGMGAAQLIDALALGTSGSSEAGKALAERRTALFLDDELGTVQAFRGAKELVCHLHDDGVRCVIASAASREEREALLEIIGGNVPFDHAVEADKIDASKPAPDVVAAALAWANVPPADAVMIGDTRFDITAAAGAQVPTIALRCGGTPVRELAGARLVLDDPAALLAALAHGSLASLLTSRSLLE